ncbi:ABC transporter substrate-binding protein [Selenomonadales bacterium OttesenSCG-928-I06]|nr:ABC transporter substrate-binding protein [Selenomonadales bacterium OttesenSCG-928-I06]
MKKALVALLVILIAVCAWGYKQQSETASTVKTRVVVDDTSKAITIPEKPQRVIALNSSNIDLYYGAGGTVIARPNKVTLNKETMAKVENLPTIGEAANPSIEQIVALKPDLVLGLNMPFNQNLVPILEKADIPVLLVSLGDYQDTLNRLKFFGELSGHSEIAQQTIDSLEKKKEEALAKNKNNAKPRTLILFGTPENYMMALPKSFPGGLIELLGAENIAKDEKGMSETLPYASFNIEFVIKANPDIVLLIVHGEQNSAEKIQQDMAKHTSWQHLKAVQEKRVYVLPFHLFGINPGVQTGEAIEYLGDILYNPGGER